MVVVKKIFRMPPMSKPGYVYMLANKPYGTLYFGVTSNLKKRIFQHKQGLVAGFSKQYKTRDLVYFEAYENIATAILREKRLKKWNQVWKIDLIERENPDWDDLTPKL